MGKLDSLHIKDNVVKKLAAGEPQTSIAEQIGVDQSTISRFVNKDEIKSRLEKEQLKLAEAAPDAVQNVKDLVEEMKDIPKDDIKRRELSYKASKDTLKAVGLFPTPQYAHSLTNIFNDNRQQTVISSGFSSVSGLESNTSADC
jgi:plasmid maintenance system antidote protein VapI